MWVPRRPPLLRRR